MGYILITGASSGLGSEFARQLAAEGHDLILVARRRDLLDALAAELITLNGIMTRSFTVDLSDLDAVAELAKTLKTEGLELDGLINNAGYGLLGDFSSMPLEGQLGMINLNVTSLMAVTHHMLPLFTQSAGNFIINVGSVASFIAIPSFAVYAASKAAVLSFSDALGTELSERGISVSTLCPGATATEFMDVAKIPKKAMKGTKFMTSEEVVKESLAKRDTAIVVTGGSNRMQVNMAKFMPRSYLRRKMANRRKGILKRKTAKA